MGQISPPAREVLAEHYDTRHLITPAMWVVIEREAMAKNASRLNGKPWRDNLIAICEGLAATP